MHEPEAPAAHAGGHNGAAVKAYLVIFAALAVFTAVSFILNYIERQGGMTKEMSFALILAVAIIKATLVGMFFMHLKYDWFKVGFMIVPALILGAMMMLVLMPDIVLAWGKFYFVIIPAFILGCVLIVVLLPDQVLIWRHNR